MKFKLLACLVLCALTCAGISTAQAAPIREVTVSELRTMPVNDGPIIVEFYDSTNTSDSECLLQPATAEKVADDYSGKVTFVRLDVSKAHDFAEALRVLPCPSHIFIDHNQPEPNRLAKRQWGYLSEAQFHELILEYFKVSP